MIYMLVESRNRRNRSDSNRRFHKSRDSNRSDQGSKRIDRGRQKDRGIVELRTLITTRDASNHGHCRQSHAMPTITSESQQLCENDSIQMQPLWNDSFKMYATESTEPTSRATSRAERANTLAGSWLGS